MGMTTRHQRLAVAAAIAAALGAAACSKPAAPSAGLQQDLAAANGGGLALAPQGAGTQVVSAVERTPAGPAAVRRSAPQPQSVRRAAPERLRVAPAPAPPPVQPVAAPVPQPIPEAVLAQAPARVPTPAPRPTPITVSDQNHRGGYKTEAEVFSHAPFPILP